MRGKEKCKALKEIRRQIAENNDIEYAVSECTFQGECKGTCPKCEAELRYLERQLEMRQKLGKAVVVAGISAGICAPMTACNPIEAIGDVIADVYYTINPEELGGEAVPVDPQQLTGDVEYIPEDIDGGLEYEEPELTGEETWNPDELESSEDLDVILPSEENSEELVGKVYVDPEFECTSEELAGEVPLAPSEENSDENVESSEDPEIEEYILEGDVVIDSEFLDEE